MVVSGGRIYETVWRAAVQRLHVRERRELSLPGVETAEGGARALAAVLAGRSVGGGDLRELFYPPLLDGRSLVVSRPCDSRFLALVGRV